MNPRHLILLVLSSLGNWDLCTSDCRANLGLSMQPLFLNTQRDNFVYPKQSSSGRYFEDGQEIVLFCPGEDNKISVNGQILESPEFTMRCDHQRFIYNSEYIDLNNVRCKDVNVGEVMITGRTCARRFIEIIIGYTYEDSFLKAITVCFDDDRKQVLYSHVTVKKEIVSCQYNYPRSRFHMDEEFYGIVEVESAYVRRREIEFVEGLLGRSLEQFRRNYMNRGHLTAKCDLVYGFLQVLTMHYVNVAPQWDSINAGNWESLERDVREYASVNSVDLEVYTGTHGQLSYPDDGGRKVDIYLARGRKGMAIPAPLYFWKVVYDPNTFRGVAFITANDYAELDKFCADICYKIDWIHWRKDDLSLGYSFCCDVDDFRRTVKTLPDIEVYNLMDSERSNLNMTFERVQLLLACCLLIVGVHPSNAECVGNLGTHEQPMFLNADKDGYVYPYLHKIYGQRYFKTGQDIVLFCPGANNTIILDGVTQKSQEISVRCGNNTFEYGTGNINLRDVRCSEVSVGEAKYNGKTCAGRYKEISIGYSYAENFISDITICFDHVQMNVLYSHVRIKKEIDAGQYNYPRPKFHLDRKFYGKVNVDNVYWGSKQKTFVEGFLGKELTYFRDNYMNKGHLTAKTDLIYGFQQVLTMHYINVVPRWKSINSGNWRTLEQDVRRYASSNAIDLEVYTGTHGQIEYPNRQGGEQYISLARNPDSGQLVFPAPLFSWKVVYDPKTRRGAAFITVNDFTKQDNLCPDVCRRISWVQWEQSNMNLGFSYCCDIDELRKTIKTIPDFVVDSLLS
ncbi:PREDICTED: uncharacterized protein LOC108559507 [Nicrophorus vespilloides]|uniref:Uncharacterized protein LOC108559507 n=1 Tax=Nicrophorus vespilloides TaxID=110193 RepID=A0ABM1MCJ9_NICVS|nr:PREDICTED: uncharacterized protein LOC108559507 [Nicrophorus vespilloides]